MESNWEFIGTDLTASYRVNTGLTGELSTVVPLLYAQSCDSGYRYSATVDWLGIVHSWMAFSDGVFNG